MKKILLIAIILIGCKMNAQSRPYYKLCEINSGNCINKASHITINETSIKVNIDGTINETFNIEGYTTTSNGSVIYHTRELKSGFIMDLMPNGNDIMIVFPENNITFYLTK